MGHEKRAASSLSSRRSVIKTVGASIALTGLAGCNSNGNGNGTTTTTTNGGGSGNAVHVGSPVPLSGPLASLGTTAQQGVESAVQYINEEQGGINGRQVEVTFGDTETDPAVGREEARRLVEQENVDVLVGSVSGAVTNSVAEYAYSVGVPFWPYGGAESTTGSNCAPTTFRYVFSAQQDALAGAPWSIENLGDKVWIHYADYSYGQSIREEWGRLIEESDNGEIIGETSTPLGTSDYASYISQIQASDADWVLMGLTGSDLIAMINQANSFGLKEQKDLVSQNLTIPIRQALGSNVVGVYGNIRYPVKDPSEVNQQFVDYYAEMHGAPPDEPAMVMWTSLMLHRQAAEEVGSVATADIVPALEGIQADTPMGQTTIRECDHQAERPYPMGRMTAPDQYDFPSYEILDTRSAEDVIEPCSETGCDMPSL